jgi:hypothetical protein
MPNNEFHSPDTNKIYSFFARTLFYADKIPKCPNDLSARMERMASNLAFNENDNGLNGPAVLPANSQLGVVLKSPSRSKIS